MDDHRPRRFIRDLNRDKSSDIPLEGVHLRRLRSDLVRRAFSRVSDTLLDLRPDLRHMVPNRDRSSARLRGLYVPRLNRCSLSRDKGDGNRPSVYRPVRNIHNTLRARINDPRQGGMTDRLVIRMRGINILDRDIRMRGKWRIVSRWVDIHRTHSSSNSGRLVRDRVRACLVRMLFRRRRSRVGGRRLINTLRRRTQELGKNMEDDLRFHRGWRRVRGVIIIDRVDVGWFVGMHRKGCVD